jgi:membrane protease YdiL (CAAX protease family)
MKIRIPRWMIYFVLFIVWVLIILRVDKTSLLYPLLFAPILEELVFRYAALEIVMSNNFLRKMKWHCCIIIGFLFGLIHWQPTMFIIQGVLGFFMCSLYLHYRARYNSGKIAYIILVLFHALWNTFCFFGLKYLI